MAYLWLFLSKCLTNANFLRLVRVLIKTLRMKFFFYFSSEKVLRTFVQSGRKKLGWKRFIFLQISFLLDSGSLEESLSEEERMCKTLLFEFGKR